MSKTKDRMRESNLRYRQSLGQNFIYDEELLAALTEAAEVSGDEDVLEIGPGCGSLTKHLCRAARKVLSIELDERLIPLLQAFLAEEKNWSVVQGDIMTVNLPEITAVLQPPFAVVANIPYYITTPLIQRLLTMPRAVRETAGRGRLGAAGGAVPVYVRTAAADGSARKLLYPAAEGGQHVHPAADAEGTRGAGGERGNVLPGGERRLCPAAENAAERAVRRVPGGTGGGGRMAGRTRSGFREVFG